MRQGAAAVFKCVPSALPPPAAAAAADNCRRLGKIIQDFSEHFTTEHAAAAVSQLAGMVTGKGLSPEQMSSVYKGPAAKVARVFEAKVQEATLKDCAK